MGTENKQVTARKQEVQNGLHTKTEVTASAYCGPLPPAEAFEKYEAVCPGAADRIIAMAERQAAHRQEIEKTVVNSGSLNSKLGIVSALFVAIAVLIGGVICILKGHDWAGGSIVAIDIVGLCGVFVYGTNMRNQ
jgi:uncharacterized membrane protein